MKTISALLLLLAALTLPSCVVPDDYQHGTTYTTSQVGYGAYSALPPGFAGEAYYYGGRYYSGGRYERGRFNYGGRDYQDRYYHNGQYIYGGRHEHHGAHRQNPGPIPHQGNRPPSGWNRDVHH